MYHMFFKHKLLVLVTFLALLFIASIISPPIPESSIQYQTLTKTPLNVSYLTNIIAFILFIIIGLKGLLFLSSKISKRRFIFKWEAAPYISLFSSLILTGFVSAHYYNHQTNYNLLFSSLLMSAVMMSLVTAVAIEWDIPGKIAKRLLAPFLIAGVISTILWHIMLAKNNLIDLRIYAFSQFLLIGFMIISSLLFTHHYLKKRYLIIALTLMLLAKVSELLDKFICHSTANIISGHAINSVLVVIAMTCILFYLEERQATLIGL